MLLSFILVHEFLVRKSLQNYVFFILCVFQFVSKMFLYVS